jgi:hypothetical protein
MSERMWLRATCAAIALLAAPGLAAAEGIVKRMSGPFKVQIGVDELGNAAYKKCGVLNLYKVTGGGREWHLDDTCDELIDVMLPTYAPTPTPPPTGGPITPTPTPRSTVSGDCPDGFLSKMNSNQWGLSNVILTEGKDHIWCVDLPQTSRFFFEIKTVNKGNTSCSDVEMTAISPTGVEYFSNGSQPGVPPIAAPGRWRIKLHLNSGCSRYDLNLVY